MSKGPSSPAPASLPDNDDILREILLRLPPLPSSLPRASLISKRWRRLVSDPHFARRFRAHHRRTPPLLGFFAYHSGDLVFTSTLDPPDRIPPARFSLSLAQRPGRRLCFLGCRHGLALLLDWALLELLVWDPVTGRHWCVAYPTEFTVDTEDHFYNGAVLGSAHTGDGDHHFRLVLVRAHVQDMLASACLYESESGKWGSISSTIVPSTNLFQSSVLAGNAFYWLLSSSSDILKFDLDRQAVAVIPKPVDASSTDLSCLQVLRTDDGKLGLAILSQHTIQLWGIKASLDGVVRWVLRKTVDLHKLLQLTTGSTTCLATIAGFDEDSNVMFVCTRIDFLMIQLESMKVTKLLKNIMVYSCYPYTSFYPAVHDVDDGAEMFNDT